MGWRLCRTNLGSPLLGTSDERRCGPISPGDCEDGVDGLSDTSTCIRQPARACPQNVSTRQLSSRRPADAACRQSMRPSILERGSPLHVRSADFARLAVMRRSRRVRSVPSWRLRVSTRDPQNRREIRTELLCSSDSIGSSRL